MLVLDIVASNGSLGVGLYHSVGFRLRWRLSAVLFSRPAKDYCWEGSDVYKRSPRPVVTLTVVLACRGLVVASMGCFKRSKEDEDEKVRKEANKKIEKQLQRDKQLYRATHRLLLLGQ